MKIVEKEFLGSLMKAGHLLRDTVIQPEQLESQLHQHLMRRMIELMKSCYRTQMLRNSMEWRGYFSINGRIEKRNLSVPTI
jgi:hypothetical protein